MTTSKPAEILDGSAITLSVLCIIHCLALPVLALASPAAALIAEQEWLHKLFVLLAVPISGTALAPARLKEQPALASALIAAGLALLVARAFAPPLEAFETEATVAGGGAAALGHVIRWRKRAR